MATAAAARLPPHSALLTIANQGFRRAGFSTMWAVAGASNGGGLGSSSTLVISSWRRRSSALARFRRASRDSLMSTSRPRSEKNRNLEVPTRVGWYALEIALEPEYPGHARGCD